MNDKKKEFQIQVMIRKWKFYFNFITTELIHVLKYHTELYRLVNYENQKL